MCYIMFMLLNIQFHQMFSYCLFFSKVDCLVARQSMFCQNVFLCVCVHVCACVYAHTQWWSCKTLCMLRAFFGGGVYNYRQDSTVGVVTRLQAG